MLCLPSCVSLCIIPATGKIYPLWSCYHTHRLGLSPLNNNNAQAGYEIASCPHCEFAMLDFHPTFISLHLCSKCMAFGELPCSLMAYLVGPLEHISLSNRCVDFLCCIFSLLVCMLLRYWRIPGLLMATLCFAVLLDVLLVFSLKH